MKGPRAGDVEQQDGREDKNQRRRTTVIQAAYPGVLQTAGDGRW